MKEIGTLADALKYGINLEESIIDFYKQLSEKEKLPNKLREIFTSFANESKDHEKYLDEKHKDCCRSDMDMGALEPVSGMEPDSYTAEMEIKPDAGGEDIVKTAIKVERKARKFYVDLGETTSYISSRETEKISQERDERVSRLESYLQGIN